MELLQVKVRVWHWPPSITFFGKQRTGNMGRVPKSARYILRDSASLPQVQLSSCTIIFIGQPDQVSISFDYDLSLNLQFKKVYASYNKIDKTLCLWWKLMFMTFNISWRNEWLKDASAGTSFHLSMCVLCYFTVSHSAMHEV